MVNWNERKFEQIASEYRVMSFDLVGIDILWRIAFESQDPQVSLHNQSHYSCPGR